MSVIIITDLDGTVVPHIQSQNRVLQPEFYDVIRSAHDARIPLYASTGRPLEMVLEDPLLKDSLAYFAGVCCKVGSEIHTWQDGRLEEMNEYTKWVHTQVPPGKQQFNIEKVRQVIAGIGFPLYEQPEKLNGHSKISFDLLEPSMAEAVRERLAQGLADMDLRIGLCPGESVCDDFDGPVTHFDFQPAATGKLGVTRFLQSHHRAVRVCYCGDSGNDEGAIMTNDPSHFMIIPINAQENLKNWARNNLGEGQYYLAQQPIAAGVLEGLGHYFAMQEMIEQGMQKGRFG